MNTRPRMYDAWVHLRHDKGEITLRLDVVATDEEHATERAIVRVMALESAPRRAVLGACVIRRPRGLLAARVQAGVTRLDQVWPGWADGVDLSTLDMGSEDDCVLAHLWGNYWTGLDKLSVYNAWELGVVFDDDPDEYDTLNRLWRKVIRDRQTALVST